MNNPNKPISLGELADKVGIAKRPVSMTEVAEKIGYKKEPLSLGELADAVEKSLTKTDKKPETDVKR